MVALISAGDGAASVPSARRVQLWAWERQEDLRFLEGHDVGVAFLASTLRLEGSRVVEFPRRQPLRVAAETELTAVVRLEADENAPLDESQRSHVIVRIVAAAKAPGVRRVQVDFDASRSQRHGYACLLRELRASLPSGMSLSMTALASWCMFDPWIDEARLPVDEVVPMVFAMGRGGADLRRRLSSEGDFRVRACRSAVGFATWEPTHDLPPGRSVYWFHDEAWTATSFRHALAKVPP
jgi:hypothetical protein